MVLCIFIFDFEFRVAVQEWVDEKSAYLRQFFFILIELSKLVQCFR